MKHYHKYVLAILFLLVIGNLMVYSSSMIWADYIYNNKYYYLIRQLIFTFLSLIFFIFFSNYDYKKLKKFINPLMIISIILLIIVLIPGIGMQKNGARSWIGIKDFSFQPSEITKIVLILFTAKFCSNNEGEFAKTKSLILYTIFLLLIFGLIMLEPDFGSGFILVITILLMMYKDLIKHRFIILGIILALFAIAGLIIIAPYRIDRINSYINPWSDPLGSGFQIIQSLYSISPSGLFGTGLFKSRQKFFFLPEPQTDFIFAIIVEELGLIGGIVIILLFFYIIFSGYKAAITISDPFGKNVLFGFSTLLFVQSFINIGVVIGLLPVTGVTLPFLSYGGSSLIITMSMMGINLNILKSKAMMPYLF